MEKHILKKSHDRVIAGVCAGIAEYLGWLPRQIRAIFVFITFIGGVFIMLIGGVFVTLMGGVVILAYFILWLSMPPADTIPPDKFDLDDFREQ